MRKSKTCVNGLCSFHLHGSSSVSPSLICGFSNSFGTMKRPSSAGKLLGCKGVNACQTQHEQQSGYYFHLRVMSVFCLIWIDVQDGCNSSIYTRH
jgi:hypothetical protein